jgi:hypothetical protein
MCDVSPVSNIFMYCKIKSTPGFQPWCSLLHAILCINDSPTTVTHSPCLLYADNIKLYMEINNENDVMKWQQGYKYST